MKYWSDKMIVNLANAKTKKTYSVNVAEVPYIGKKLGDSVDLADIGLKGKGQITGGTAKDGLPMVPFIESQTTKNVLLSDGIAFKAKHDGEKKRRKVYGKIISDKIAQINVKIIDIDESINLDEKFPKKVEEKKK
jgi:small subunit ribosomal protein S6e